MAILGLGHTGLWVTDLPTMRDFYERVIGLTVTDEDEEQGIVFFSAQPDVEHHEASRLPVLGAAGDATGLKDTANHLGRQGPLGVLADLALAHDGQIRIHARQPTRRVTAVIA